MLNYLVDQILGICGTNAEGQDDVEKQLRELLNGYVIKKASPDSNLADANQKLNMFLLSKKMEGLSEKTIDKYRKTILDFAKYVNKPLKRITTADIRTWLSNRDIKISTVRYRLAVLRSFYNYLLAEEIVAVDPTRRIKSPKLEKRIPKALNNDELEVLREGCNTLREKALLEIFYATGCRIGEVFGANKIDINWQERSLVVLGKGNKERIVFIGARAAHSLKKYLNSRQDNEDALFVTEKGKIQRLSVRSIQLIFKKIANRVVIHKNIYPHIFRHTLATALLNHGARLEDVQDLLGHTNPSTTQIYCKVSPERKKLAYNQHFVN
ncbi:phage integrase family protein [Desulforamulus reducens MI-1]|uniref:Phage integrase family protein n=1 Tax=Desulforamulus reducens (strain ATCC BAA-1160 / DSM 100696 / MI-1) TaxID=349161 RepID=A4J349_DESRM|nr:site-specific tyrosine recombinase/integron integrase [Desulforamulus reducens]ABO49502.1 phage integrase family protein [Desulforamulus reducens MI-1]